MAHQMNLIFGEIFKESELYQRTSNEAIRIVSLFHNSTFFTGNLRDEQMRIYKKTITLVTPGETRWNSYYFCFHSILKIKSALKVCNYIYFLQYFSLKYRNQINQFFCNLIVSFSKI